jgi:hypothetical protein
MGKPTGFLEYQRLSEVYEAVERRVGNYREFVHALSDDAAKVQGARCMDCGIPFCNSGCPINNLIPDWNDLVYHGRWREAAEMLHSTNNFPEFTSRVCPAPCEEACTLNIDKSPVGIKSIEHAIIDKAGENGWVVPQPPSVKSGRKVAVVGSGPAGLTAAQVPQFILLGFDDMADAIFGDVDFEPPFVVRVHYFQQQLAIFHGAHPQQFFEAERRHDARNRRTNRQAVDLPLVDLDLLAGAFYLDLELL